MSFNIQGDKCEKNVFKPIIGIILCNFNHADAGII